MLLDLMMPGMDGFELAKQVRMNADFGECSLIMVSSAVRSGDASRCRELGIDRYMTKPVVQSDLLKAILEVVGSRASMRCLPERRPMNRRMQASG